MEHISKYLEKYKEKTLSQIKEEAQEIAGEWNGDESGVKEDRALIASDIIDKVDEIRELLAELN